MINLIDFSLYIFIGFTAQIIDGSLGMGYGVICNSFLLGLGIPGISPLIASSSIHFAELFTTALSGLSHNKIGNIDKSLFKKLIFPGVTGGIIGAYILSSFSGQIVKPLIYSYLLLMGLKILITALTKNKSQSAALSAKKIPFLGLAGGFLDAIGGGGWGPIVTTTLVANNHQPRLAIGTVNTVEFFVTLSESITFVLTIGNMIFNYWQIILGILLGGAIAAPLSAILCKNIPTRPLMFFVGILVTFLSCRTLFNL